MHNHKHCHEHILKHCKVCDVVYCEECGKEWKQNYYTYTWKYPYVTWEGDGVNPNYTITTASTEYIGPKSEIIDDKAWTCDHKHE